VNRDGFSLIECMVYCVIVATIMMLWFNGVASFTRVCTTQAGQINLTSTAYSALDVFVRDIRKAPHNFNEWPLMTDTACVFKLDEYSIGWEYKDGQLFRYQGNYNGSDKQWVKKTKSLVLDALQGCSFAYNRSNQTMVSIEITLMTQGKKLNRISYLGG